MIHVLREGESPEVVALIYGVTLSELEMANKASRFAPRSALWVPCPPTYFPSKDEAIESIASSLSLPYEDLYRANGRVTTAKADVPLRLPESANGLFSFSVLFGRGKSGFPDPQEIAQAVPFLSLAVLDVYDTGDSLSEPDDESLIALCHNANTVPGFLVAHPSEYMRGGILDSLLHDLMFKEYETAFMFAFGENELKDASRMCAILDDYGVSSRIVAPARQLMELPSMTRADRLFFVPPAVQSFDSFAGDVTALCERFGPKRVGYAIPAKRAAIVNPNANVNGNAGLKARAISPDEMARIIEAGKAGEVTYDESRQLASFALANGDSRCICEDLRSLYARMSILSELGVSDIFTRCSDGMLPMLEGIARMLSAR